MKMYSRYGWQQHYTAHRRDEQLAVLDGPARCPWSQKPLVCAEHLSSAVLSLIEAPYWRSYAVAIGLNDAWLSGELQQHIKYLKKMHVLSDATVQTVTDCFSGTRVSSCHCDTIPATVCARAQYMLTDCVLLS